MIEIEGLGRRYAERQALAPLDLVIPEGQFTVLLGPSGSGKTTLLRLINRMIEPTSGTVRLNGVDTVSLPPEALRREMGYVIQHTGLFPHMTVRRNVETVPRLLGWDRARIRARTDEMLELVGLDPSVTGDKKPAQLSGGEAQRVGVARALAADPPVLLMDEPFGAVDPITREKLQAEIKRLHGLLGKTIVFITHDIDEAVLLADRIAVLCDGRLQQYATPEEMWRTPANDFVREFCGDGLGLRVMARHGLQHVRLAAAGGEQAEGLPRVDADASLRDALAALVDARAAGVAVVRDGRVEGIADFRALVDALAAERRP